MNKARFIIGAFLALGIGYFGYQALLPPVTEGHSMAPPDLSGIAAGDPIADVELPETLSETALIGKNIFDAACAACHGQNAAGQNGVAPPLVHRTYEPSHHSDMAFVMAARNGVQAHHWNFGNMPPIEGLTDGDVMMVARYVRELQQANGIF